MSRQFWCEILHPWKLTAWNPPKKVKVLLHTDWSRISSRWFPAVDSQVESGWLAVPPTWSAGLKSKTAWCEPRDEDVCEPTMAIILYLEPKWPLFWLEKALFWGGWPSKIEVIGVLGISKWQANEPTGVGFFSHLPENLCQFWGPETWGEHATYFRTIF